MRSLTTGEAASATKFAGQSVTSHIRRFRSLNEGQPAAPRTATLADDWQLASRYAARPAALHSMTANCQSSTAISAKRIVADNRTDYSSADYRFVWWRIITITI